MADKDYMVSVCRIGYGHLDIQVTAQNKKEADKKALEAAGNYVFSEHTSEYQANGVTLIKKPGKKTHSGRRP